MTDFSSDVQALLDESYESDLTEEESEELLRMCGHGIGPKLSPAAQAVFYAFNSRFDWIEDGVPGPQFSAIAAALRAAADQVVPWKPEPTEDSIGPTIDYGYAWALFSQANDIRQELIAIADELEAQ